MSQSAIYEATVRHHRLQPKVHQFQYRVFYLWLDLDEIDALAASSRIFRRNAFSLFAFHDRDHLEIGQQGTKANILAFLADGGIPVEQIASVRLLTFPRILGYIFNPVCFYYAFDASGQPLAAVAEVTNTFHEQKPYLLNQLEACATTGGAASRFRLITPKHFYVSPFVGLELNFDFKLGVPGEHLEIHIDDRAGDDRTILTSLTGKRRDFTDSGLLWCFCRYPLLTLRVIFLIHWHAFRLWLKKIPWHRKGDHPEQQTGVLRPHASIRPTPAEKKS
jgi:uncharacterized protein